MEKYETVAEIWKRYFNAVPTTEDGCHSRTPWGNGVREAMAEATAVGILDPQLEDPAVSLEFEDGSVLEIVNPAQKCFPGVARLIS